MVVIGSNDSKLLHDRCLIDLRTSTRAHELYHEQPAGGDPSELKWDEGEGKKLPWPIQNNQHTMTTWTVIIEAVLLVVPLSGATVVQKKPLKLLCECGWAGRSIITALNLSKCGTTANMWFLAVGKNSLHNPALLWLFSQNVRRWVWQIMPAIVEPHAQRDSHSRHTEPPTKGWQLAWEAPTWTRMMPVWVAPRGTCQLYHWRQGVI